MGFKLVTVDEAKRVTVPVTVRQYIGRATNKYRHRYRKMVGCGRWEYPEYSIPRADHAFQLGPYLVSRPYRMGGDAVCDLVEWAEKCGLDFEIDAPSSWHPATLLIMVYEPRSVREFFEGAERYGDAFESSLLQRLYYESHSEVTGVRSRWAAREMGIYVLNARKSSQGGYARDGRSDQVEDFLAPQKAYTLNGAD